MSVEGFLIKKGPSINPCHHDVVGVAAPISAGHAPQLEGVAGNVLCGVNMWPLAHIQEGSIAIKRQAFQAVLLNQLSAVFHFVRFAHLINTRKRIFCGEVFAIKTLTFLNDLLHLLHQRRKILFRKRLGQNEVVIKAITNRRTKP